MQTTSSQVSDSRTVTLPDAVRQERQNCYLPEIAGYSGFLPINPAARKAYQA
jgi:hypothetical protein